MAFAPNLSHKRFSVKPTFVDLETMNIITTKNSWKYPSDAFCTEYLEGSRGNTVMYGHRSGGISILDYRSGSLSYIMNQAVTHNGRAPKAFGSVTNLLNFPTVGGCNGLGGTPFTFLARGSFGSCRIFDTRRLGGPTASPLREKSLLMELSAPENIGAMMTARCSGVALDPTGQTIISPYVSDSGNNVRLGLWSLATGKLVDEIKPFTEHNFQDLCSEGAIPVDRDKAPSPPTFCELSPTITHAWGLDSKHSLDTSGVPIATNQIGRWGLWMKCGSCIRTPVEAGGIHHVTFSGRI